MRDLVNLPIASCYWLAVVGPGNGTLQATPRSLHSAAAPHENRRQTKRVRGSPRYKPQLPFDDMHSVASIKKCMRIST